MLPLPSQIPYLSPQYVGDKKSSGRTQPYQMVCESGADDPGYIVKLWAHPEVSLGKHSLAREVYGSLLAKSFGIQTPDIAIIEISPDFYRSQPTQNEEKVKLLKDSAGLNFGSKYIPGAVIFSPPVPKNKCSEAAKIFCFDMLLGNVDRQVERPNLFDMPNGFVVFDHEQAFPYSRPNTMVGGFPPCWDFIKESWHKKHVFYQSLRNHDCSLEIEEFMTFVGCISDDLLDTIEDQIPGDWRSGDGVQYIRSYLANIRNNQDRFKRSLQEILA